MYVQMKLVVSNEPSMGTTARLAKKKNVFMLYTPLMLYTMDEFIHKKI